MKHYIKQFVILSFLISGNLFGSEGILYQAGSNYETILFTQTIDKSENGISHLYFDKDGELAGKETIKIKEENEFSYFFYLRDADTEGVLHYENGKITMTSNIKGKTREKEINYTGDVITGPTFETFIQSNLMRIKEGEKIEVRIPYFDLMILLPFIIEPDFKSDQAKKGQIAVKVRLKNFILGALIDPIEFIYTIEEKKLLSIHGPTILPVPGQKELAVTDIIYQD